MDVQFSHLTLFTYFSQLNPKCIILWEYVLVSVECVGSWESANSPSSFAEKDSRTIMIQFSDRPLTLSLWWLCCLLCCFLHLGILFTYYYQSPVFIPLLQLLPVLCLCRHIQRAITHRTCRKTSLHHAWTPPVLVMGGDEEGSGSVPAIRPY